MTATQAAVLWGLSLTRVCQLCRQRRIPGARLVGRVWQIPADAVITPGSRGPKR